MGAYEIRKSAAERVGYPLSDLGVMEAAMRCQHCDPGWCKRHLCHSGFSSDSSLGRFRKWAIRKQKI
jgi:hypothetical protein